MEISTAPLETALFPVNGKEKNEGCSRINSAPLEKGCAIFVFLAKEWRNGMLRKVKLDDAIG